MLVLCALVGVLLGNASGLQVLSAYYSGVGLSSLTQSVGLNTLALAFFNPGPMAQHPCTFTPTTPCVVPASGAGPDLSLAWIHETVNSSYALLQNPSPLYFVSFGGESQGGAVWDQIFGDATSAKIFGENAAALVQALTDAHPSVSFGIDLDIEETSTNLTHIGAFISAFRAVANFDDVPLQMCALSGFMFNSSGDYYKLAILQEHGPAQGGISHVNMMVDNVYEPCSFFTTLWNASVISFLPPHSRVGGCWGLTNPSWILQNPGCTGDGGLFPWMAANSVGLGIWEWWVGDPTPIQQVLSQIAAN
eukprot:m.432075 g.432075  ORF g.432075 m.432075 type:complete len:306 (-) comp56746_c0_seq5:4260-5177(-)